MRRSLDEPNSLRAIAPIMRVKPSALRPAGPAFTAMPEPAAGAAFFDLHWCKRRLAAGPTGFPRHKRGSHPCQLAIFALFLVKFVAIFGHCKGGAIARLSGLRRRPCPHQSRTKP